MPPAIWGATACLLLLTTMLYFQTARSGRTLHYKFVPRAVHYVQLLAHTSIFIYWGAYWPEVRRHVPALLAQIAFAYALDMLVCWYRRDEWWLSFGLVPIVLSTNLFLWFKDDWFYFQLLLIATGILAKEFIKWQRDGRLTHIFNPSAFSLFVFSVILIATGATPMTFGEEIAVTLGRPPHIYLWIFFLGLVVQALFSVTLVTLSAATTLALLNIAFTHWTGVYHFIDSNIPIAVFLGMHLLVTDPATSPKKTFGKIVFGSLYGAGVFAMYGVLAWLGAPRFYDKLLCVPALNLGVRVLDRASIVLDNRLQSLKRSLHLSLLDPIRNWSPRQLNFAYIFIWVCVFVAMFSTDFVSGPHPGESVAFWANACEQGRWGACQTWERTLAVKCDLNSPKDCFDLGVMQQQGGWVRKNPIEAAQHLNESCDFGYALGCTSFQQMVQEVGLDVYQRACDKGYGPSCYIVGIQYRGSPTLARDDAKAFAFFERACNDGSGRGCERLAEQYFMGRGAAVNKLKALQQFDRACNDGYAPGCLNAGTMYRRGDAGYKDDPYGLQRIAQACELGLRAACPQPRQAMTSIHR